jgi:hypothetical protein
MEEVEKNKGVRMTELMEVNRRTIKEPMEEVNQKKIKVRKTMEKGLRKSLVVTVVEVMKPGSVHT